MSIISFRICALLLLSAISALRTPNYVISAIIHNKQDEPVRCTIQWNSIDGPLKDNNQITIDGHESKTVEGKTINMGDWTAFARIESIQCGDSVLTHPFNGVTLIENLWNFDYESNNLLSAGPTRHSPQD